MTSVKKRSNKKITEIVKSLTQKSVDKKTIKKPQLDRTDWIEVKPYGLSLGAMQKPLFLFKEVDGERILPIWMSETDTAVTISQAHSQKDNSTHRVSKDILGQLGWELKSCYFSEIKGPHQYLSLNFGSTGGSKGTEEVKVVEARAEESLSFCLQWDCPFYCDQDFIERSRVSEASIEEALMTESHDGEPIYLN